MSKDEQESPGFLTSNEVMSLGLNDHQIQQMNLLLKERLHAGAAAALYSILATCEAATRDTGYEPSGSDVLVVVKGSAELHREMARATVGAPSSTEPFDYTKIVQAAKGEERKGGGE